MIAKKLPFRKLNQGSKPSRTGKVAFFNLYLLYSLLPIFWTILLCFVVLSQATPGFRVEVTQDCFIVSKVDNAVNDLQPGDCITHISGIPYRQVLEFGTIFRFDSQSDSGVDLTLKARSSPIRYRTVPITVKSLFSAVWLQILWVLFTSFLAIAALYKSPPGQPSGLFSLTYSSFCLIIINEIPCQLGLMVPWLLSFSFWSVAIFHWVAFSSWFHFVFQFPVERQLLKGKTKTIVAIYLLPPAGALLMTFFATHGTDNYAGHLQLYRYWATPLIIGITFFKHCIDFQKTRSSIAGTQLKLLLSGGFLGIAPYIFLYLFPNILFDRPFIAFRVVILFGTLIPLAVFFAIIRYKLMEVDSIISRGATYVILIISLALVYSGFLVTIKSWMWGDQHLSNEIFLAFIVCVALVFNPVKNRVESFIDRVFLKDPIDYGRLMHVFSTRIVKTIKLDDLVELLTIRFPHEFRIEKCLLLVFNQKSDRFYPQNVFPPDLRRKLDKMTLTIEKQHTPVCIYDLDGTESDLDGLARIMKQLECPVMYRLESSGRCLGALFIGSKINRKIYTGAEIQVFATLANNSAIAIENAQMYETLKESRDQVHEMFNKVTQAEKLAAIGEMTTVLAHEIRNPLAIIRSSVEFLSARQRDPDIQAELLSNIIEEIDTLAVFVNNTLGLARCKAPQFNEIDLNMHLKKLTEKWIAASDHNSLVTICLGTNRELPWIFADEKQLTQVFVNLILNSEEAMPKGGTVTIELHDNPDTGHVTVFVKDRGDGISGDQKENIFQKFYTGKPGGLGLGLAVCDQIITSHNGSISIENRENGGACAIVHLPYRPYKNLP